MTPGTVTLASGWNICNPNFLLHPGLQTSQAQEWYTTPTGLLALPRSKCLCSDAHDGLVDHDDVHGALRNGALNHTPLGLRHLTLQNGALTHTPPCDLTRHPGHGLRRRVLGGALGGEKMLMHTTCTDLHSDAG